MARVKPLAIQIATGDSRSIARQLVDAIRFNISTGGLTVEDQVPSVRGLAQQVGVNPNTVSKAYAQLIAEGWLTSRAGLGLFVAVRRDQLSGEERERRLAVAVDQFVNEVIAIRAAPEQALAEVADALGALSMRKSA